MTEIRGTYIAGHIIVDEPLPDWPDGRRVTIEVAARRPGDPPDDGDNSPEAVAYRLARMDEVEPWMTPEEDAAWREQRARDKAADIERMKTADRDIENLFR